MSTVDDSWRKSSYSAGAADACVELSWRKSSYSNGGPGTCVELGWRKSSRSTTDNPACVELSRDLAVRDSKNPTGPTLRAGGASLVALAKAWPAPPLA